VKLCATKHTNIITLDGLHKLMLPLLWNIEIISVSRYLVNIVSISYRD